MSQWIDRAPGRLRTITGVERRPRHLHSGWAIRGGLVPGGTDRGGEIPAVAQVERRAGATRVGHFLGRFAPNFPVRRARRRHCRKL